MAFDPKGKFEVKDPELLKPLMFSKSQRAFTYITFIVSAGLMYYCVFKHNWGEKRNCFSWIREVTEESKKRFFSISEEDHVSLEEQKTQSQQQKQQQQQKFNKE